MVNAALVEAAKNGFATEFERRLFDAALANQADAANPLRFNNFAYAVRELTRHVLSRLAPDEKVRNCRWYKEETGKPLRVSRRQRTVYAVQGGLDDRYVEDDLGLDVHSIHARLRDAIDNLSKYTHVEESTFAIPSVDVDRMTDEMLTALSDLFQVIDKCKHEVAQALEQHVNTEVVDHVLAETVQAIDELATHHSIDEVYTNQVKVEAIDDQFIHIIAHGKIKCELQWGSNSDLMRGDGAVLPQSFPFTCELKSDVETLGDFHPDWATLRVDTSSWRDETEPWPEETSL